MLTILENEGLTVKEYDRFVKGVSYANADEILEFTQPDKQFARGPRPYSARRSRSNQHIAILCFLRAPYHHVLFDFSFPPIGAHPPIN